MKVSVSLRRTSRRVAKSLGVLFILAIVVLAYAFTSLTAFASAVHGSTSCPDGTYWNGSTCVPE